MPSSTTDEKLLPDSHEFQINEVCYCKYMTKGLERWYEAKILKIKKDKKKDEVKYFVHYQGWNKRFDFWAREDSLVKDSERTRKIAEDLEKGIYDARMKGRSILEVLEAGSEDEEEIQEEFKRKKEEEQKAKEERELEKKRKKAEKEALLKAEKQIKQEEQRKRSLTPVKQEAHQHKKHAKISPLPPMIRKIPLAVKKVDKSDAIESFRREDDNFDVIEAPHDAEDVLRGDNFDSQVTEELIAVIEADMKKMKSNLMILPTKTNILDIFNNYVKWHLVYEIIQDHGVSRRIAGDYENMGDTRSFCVNFRPLSYKQELTRTIQILWPILALLLDEEFFEDNLLYESECEQFKKLTSSSKFDDPAEHMKDKEIKKPTRKSVLEEQCTIPTESRWFLKENDQQLQRKVEQFVIDNEISEDLTWIFEDNLGESFSFVTAEAFSGKNNKGPSPIHIYGARHLLRFFGHWIYKVGFIDKFVSGTIPDWQLEAADRQIESLMRFILFTYKDECLPDIDKSYSFNPKK